MTSFVYNCLSREVLKNSHRVELCEVLNGTFATKTIFCVYSKHSVAPLLPGLRLSEFDMQI